MPYQVKFSNAALKDLRKLQPSLQKRIIAEADRLAENPRHSGIKKLVNSPYYRARVGDYRILYDIQDNVLTVMILKIEHRSSVYRQ